MHKLNPTLQACFLLRAGDDDEHSKNSTQAEKRMTAAQTQPAFPRFELLTSSDKWADPDLIRGAQQLLAAGSAKQAHITPITAQNQLADKVEYKYLPELASLDSCKLTKPSSRSSKY